MLELLVGATEGWVGIGIGEESLGVRSCARVGKTKSGVML